MSETTQPVMITKRDLQDIVTESVDKGVGRAFTRLGIDFNDPIEMQHDFRHLRASRETLNSIKTHSLKVITTAIVGGLLAYLILGFSIGDTHNTSGKSQLSDAEIGLALAAKAQLSEVQIGLAIVEMAKKKALEADNHVH